ncbi:TPA: hypothetical protein IHD35_000551 [Escherichia coli]|nr:hypothetical protein [Escherichia coli]HAO1322232.1 hypothetical protein [Escherichia coli]
MANIIAKINCHPYPVHIWFTNSHRFHASKCYSEGIDTDGAEGCAGICSSSEPDRGRQVVGVFDNDLTTLVHEVQHAVINLCHYIGMPINTQTTEAVAYIYDSIFTQCKDINDKWGSHG